jgi:hypothetical protein
VNILPGTVVNRHQKISGLLSDVTSEKYSLFGMAVLAPGAYQTMSKISFFKGCRPAPTKPLLQVAHR